ncbi:MAG: septum formation initiator family protein [Candidatus Ornithomonoglobus sp.]
MKGFINNKLVDFLVIHKRGILLWAVILASGSMIFKGVMQRPQINQYRAEIADLNEKIQQERDRQAEIDDLKTKVNTDEYIEKIASEKLGLVKSNAKIFIDVSDDN